MGQYGYQSTEEISKETSAEYNFGLNTGVTLSKFEYNPNGGTSGATGDSIDLEIKFGEKSIKKRRFFPVTKIFKDNVELTDTNSEDYKKLLAVEMSLFNATLTDIASCFVDREVLKQALSTPISNFKTYAEILERLIKSSPSWETKPLDVFLQYQWKPSANQEKTYLELPKDIKHGSFICASKGKGFILDKTDSHIRYHKDGEEHPFSRGDWYVKSNFSNRVDFSTKEDQSNNDTGKETGVTW